MVSQEKRGVIDHDHSWALPLRHPFQLLRSGSDDVSRTISDFAAKTAPSNFFKFFSLLSLGGILLNFFYFCDDLRLVRKDCVIWSLYTICRFSGDLLPSHPVLCAELLEDNFRSSFLRHLELQTPKKYVAVSELPEYLVEGVDCPNRKVKLCHFAQNCSSGVLPPPNPR